MKYLCILATLLATQAQAAEVLRLPEEKCYTTIYAETKDTPLAAWFQSDPDLRSLRSHTHFSVMTRSDPQFPAHAQAVGELPAILVTYPDGRTLFKASGANIPGTPAQLVAMMQQSPQGSDTCRNPNCRCKQPPPAAPPAAPVEPVTVPDIFSKVEPEKKDDVPFWLAIAIGVAGIAVAIVPQIVKKYQSLTLGGK